MSPLPRALGTTKTVGAFFLRHLARKDFGVVVVKNSSSSSSSSGCYTNALVSTFARLGEIDFCPRRGRRNATAATTSTSTLPLKARSVPVSSSREEKQRHREGVLLLVSLTNRIHASAAASAAARANEEDNATLESNFSQKANEYLETLGEKLESWADEEIEEDVECDYSDGVLTISLGRGRGTYVLNKQAPNRQIWWSSPISGPHRFEEEGERWVDARRGEKDCLDDLETKLKSEWGKLFKGKKELRL
jgi:frataxin